MGRAAKELGPGPSCSGWSHSDPARKTRPILCIPSPTPCGSPTSSVGSLGTRPCSLHLHAFNSLGTEPGRAGRGINQELVKHGRARLWASLKVPPALGTRTQGFPQESSFQLSAGLGPRATELSMCQNDRGHLTSLWMAMTFFMPFPPKFPVQGQLPGLCPHSPATSLLRVTKPASTFSLPLRDTR